MSELDCSDCSSPAMLGLKALQRDILEGVARGLSTQLIMSALCVRVERMAPEVICSILSVDATGRLHPLAGPSLPQEYSAALDGILIGPSAGSCGTAAFVGQAVEVADIAMDPLWAEFKDLALPLGLRACWSSPVRAADGRVVGTFAFYYRTCRGPSELDRKIVEATVDLCAIAFEREERKASIQWLAYFDRLTGVANRDSFERVAQDALARAEKSNSGVAIHLLDLDDFQSVNDTFGHQAGDELLKVVAQRLNATLSRGAFFARFGGDEFVVLQPSSQHEEIEDFANRLAEAVRQPVEIAGTAASIGASIGVARAPADGFNLAGLIKKADLALYETKSRRRRSVGFFDAAIEARVASCWQTEQDLSRALARDEFELHFQPLVNLEKIEVAGFEALIRWRRPGHGLVGPLQFLPIGEKTGLILEIGDWVLREACRLAAAMPKSTRVAVNLSPTQLTNPGFALGVANALSAHDLAPHRLELEITESALLVESPVTIACLMEIRRLGVKIALDDFGTGFSTLSHLRAFPVDRIKIDCSFVQEIEKKRETASIVRTIIWLARELGVKTTAEGVETLSQLRLLRDFGCQEIQGFLISRPKPLAAFLGADPAAGLGQKIA